MSGWIYRCVLGQGQWQTVRTVEGGGGVLQIGIGFKTYNVTQITNGARCSSVVRAFAHGAIGRRIDPSL